MSTTPGRHCLLCGSSVEADEIPLHLRIVHEVTAGELTMADVPEEREGPANQPWRAAQQEQELVGAMT